MPSLPGSRSPTSLPDQGNRNCAHRRGETGGGESPEVDVGVERPNEEDGGAKHHEPGQSVKAFDGDDEVRAGDSRKRPSGDVPSDEISPDVRGKKGVVKGPDEIGAHEEEKGGPDLGTVGSKQNEPSRRTDGDADKPQHYRSGASGDRYLQNRVAERRKIQTVRRPRQGQPRNGETDPEAESGTGAFRRFVHWPFGSSELKARPRRSSSGVCGSDANVRYASTACCAASGRPSATSSHASWRSAVGSPRPS